MTKTRSWGARVAAVAGAVALLAGVSTVNAQPADGVDVAFVFAPGGTVAIAALGGALEIPVPDPNPEVVTGSWSPTTGEFAGSLSSAPLSLSVSLLPGGDPVPVSVSLQSTGVTGTIPPDGAVGSVTIAGLALALSVPGLLPSCVLPVGDTTVAAQLTEGTPAGLSLVADLAVSVSPLPTGCEPLGLFLGDATTLSVALDLKLAQAGGETPVEPEAEVTEAKPAFTG